MPEELEEERDKLKQEPRELVVEAKRGKVLQAKHKQLLKWADQLEKELTRQPDDFPQSVQHWRNRSSLIDFRRESLDFHLFRTSTSTRLNEKKYDNPCCFPFFRFRLLLGSLIFDWGRMHLSFHRADRGLLSRLWHLFRLRTHVHLFLVERVRRDCAYVSERKKENQRSRQFPNQP